MMHCPKCGHENKETAKFCVACGAGLTESGTAKTAAADTVVDAKEAAQAAKRKAKEATEKAAQDAKRKAQVFYHLFAAPAARGIALVVVRTAALVERWIRVLIPLVLVSVIVVFSWRYFQRFPDMVEIPPGTFRMGDLNGGGDSDEKPVRTITISYAFEVGKYEVTFDEWDACEADGGCSRKPSSEGWGRGDRPVINVSWNDAQQYIRWLNDKTGRTYRLLSEAEWEYAARAGTSTKYPWGNSIRSSNANCDGCGNRWDNEKTAPVGSFRPNAFGVYDMHGNVWEWVEDCYEKSYNNTPTDGGAQKGNNSCNRIIRGGSWDNGPRNLRSAIRFRYSPGSRGSILGFRLARTL